MVHLETLNIMRAHIRENWQEYVKSHPGEYVLLEQVNQGLQERFFRSKKGLEDTISKYKNMFGPTFLTEHIPKKSHRYNPNNELHYFSIDTHLTTCPNDNKTKLKSIGGIGFNSQAKPGTEYTEEAYCPDCNCHVFRRPTDKAIAESEKRLKNMVLGQNMRIG